MMQYVEVEDEGRIFVYLDEEKPEDISSVDPSVDGYVFFQFHSAVSLYLAESALCEVVTDENTKTKILRPLGVYDSRRELAFDYQKPRLRFNLRAVPDDYRDQVMKDILNESTDSQQIHKLYRWPATEPFFRDMTHG